MNIQSLIGAAQQHATATLAGVSVTSTAASFVAKTFPYVQYAAVILGAVSAVFAILVAIKKLRQ